MGRNAVFTVFGPFTLLKAEIVSPKRLEPSNGKRGVTRLRRQTPV